MASQVRTEPWMETNKNRHAYTVTALAYSTITPRFTACRCLKNGADPEVVTSVLFAQSTIRTFLRENKPGKW